MSISQFIQDDLRVRLEEGYALPGTLTLSSLSQHYHTSITPVRQAVDALIHEGILSKGDNHRLKVVPRPKVRVRPTQQRKSLPQPPLGIFEIVSNDLARLSLEGSTEYLREIAMAKKYDISRSAIRNIFSRLAGAGLLDHIPNRGWKIRPFRWEDVRAFLDVREVLELKALELAWPRLGMEEIRQILDSNALPSSEGELPQIDDSLHAYVIEKSENFYIRDFFQRHGKFFDILFVWEAKDRPTAIETVRQHRRFLEDVLNRDLVAARASLSFHIRENHPILGQLAQGGGSAEGSTDTISPLQLLGKLAGEPAASMVRRSYTL